MAKFQDHFNKLVKRANRIGCQAPSFNIIQESSETIQVLIGEDEDEFGRRKPVYEDRIILRQHITIQNPEVIVAGYEFISTIEHTEDGNILHSLAGKQVPVEYRTSKAYCDHCKVLRKRNDTFVLHHLESNKHIQVGRNCLSDFLGKDAERIAALAELYFEFNELAEASEKYGSGSWGSSGPSFDHLDTYLSFVAESISRSGWRSRTTAKEYGGKATADVAYSIMHLTKEDIRLQVFDWWKPSINAEKTAKEAMEWCSNLPDAAVEKSDYLHNIRLISKRGLVGARQYGFAASIVSSYQNHLMDEVRLKRQAEQAFVSNYVGEVNARRFFTLTIEHVISLPDRGYGSSNMHKMVDDQGNCFVWVTGGDTILEKGKTIHLQGTIKAHSEYKGIKQTVLTRCKQVDLRQYQATLDGAVYTVPEVSEKGARKALETTLKIKLPRGFVMSEVRD